MDDTPVLTIQVFKDGDHFRTTFEASWLYGVGRKKWPSPPRFEATSAMAAVGKVLKEVDRVGTYSKRGPQPRGYPVAKRLIE